MLFASQAYFRQLKIVPEQKPQYIVVFKLLAINMLCRLSATISERHWAYGLTLMSVDGANTKLSIPNLQLFNDAFADFRRFITFAVKKDGCGSLRVSVGEDAKPTPKTL